MEGIKNYLNLSLCPVQERLPHLRHLSDVTSLSFPLLLHPKTFSHLLLVPLSTKLTLETSGFKQKGEIRRQPAM